MNTNLANFTQNFLSELFFHFLFFRTPEILYLNIFPFFTLWKFFFGHLDFFSHKTLRFFLRHYTDTWHFFFDFKKNLANVHPRTIDKFPSNIECNWHRNSLKPIELTQSNIIEFIATRQTNTHTYLVWSKEIWAANSEFNRVSRENSA